MTPEERKQKRREYLSLYQSKWVRKRRDDWMKANGPCRMCGSDQKLELDHIDPTQKVSHRIWSWARDRFEAEASKCQVLCRDCHRRKTAHWNGMRMLGQPGPVPKLNPSQVQQIRRRLAAGVTQRKIAAEFGVTNSVISRINTGRNWSWLDREGSAS